MARADVIDRLAQHHGCSVGAMTAMWDQVLAAFRQAMAEFGIGEHSCGSCPATEVMVTARAYELLGIQED